MRRRAQAAQRTRAAIVAAVHRLLDGPDPSRLTLEEVARAAGVTRATVYTRFGSRRALLTAAFVDQGRLIQYDRVIAAMALDDPREALSRTLREVCRGWETIPQAIRRVLALAVLDPEIGEVVDGYERARQEQMASLASRLDTPLAARDAGAILGAFTSPQAYFLFRDQADARAAARRLEQAAVAALRLPPRTK